MYVYVPVCMTQKQSVSQKRETKVSQNAKSRN